MLWSPAGDCLGALPGLLAFGADATPNSTHLNSLKSNIEFKLIFHRNSQSINNQSTNIIHSWLGLPLFFLLRHTFHGLHELVLTDDSIVVQVTFFHDHIVQILLNSSKVKQDFLLIKNEIDKRLKLINRHEAE